MRKHFCAYTRGCAGGAGLRNRLVQAANKEDYRAIFNMY
jgi:hypothetical protein